MKSSKELLMPSLSAFFLTVLPFINSSAVGWWLVQNESYIRSFSVREWAIASLVCALACALALTPPTLLAFVFGYFLGWIALLPLILLNLAAIALVYLFVQRIDRDSLLRYLSQFPKIARFLQRIHGDEIRFVFFTKLSPVLPFALTNLIFALMGLRFRNIIWGGFLGMIPRTALAVWVGMEAQHIKQLLQNPNQGLESRVIIIVLVILSVIGLLRVVAPKEK